MKFLEKTGIPLSAIDKLGEFGETHLTAACKNGDVEMATALLQCGANVHEANATGMIPLTVACENKHFDVAGTTTRYAQLIEVLKITN